MLENPNTFRLAVIGKIGRLYLHTLPTSDEGVASLLFFTFPRAYLSFAFTFSPLKAPCHDLHPLKNVGKEAIS